MVTPPSAFALASTFYFVLFFSIGSISPFYTLWFRSIGITEQQVGIITASPSFAMVLTTVFIGRLADRAKDWRTTLIICNWLVALLTMGLLFVNSFYGVLLIWTVTGILMMAISPILDAATLRMAQSQNTDYHKMRAFGSGGFILGVLLAGAFFDWAGIKYFVAVIIGLAWAKALLGHSLPYFKSSIKPAHESDKSIVHDTITHGADATLKPAHKQNWFLLALSGSALIHASHAYYYIFGTLIWVDAGYSTRTAAVLWALGVLIEVIVMWRFSDWSKRFPARMMLLFAACAAALRWCVFAYNPPFALMVAAQMLHGFVFALMFLATLNFIANWTPVSIAARTQALSATLNTACMALVTLGSGYLHAALGVQGYWIMLLLCAMAMILIACSYKLSPERKPSLA